MPPKKIEYADFLTQFELLYRNTIMFEMKSKNLRCSKTQITRSLLYKILFFEIVVLTKLKKIIRSGAYIIKKINWKYRPSYSKSRQRQHSGYYIDEGKWTNYIINLESKLKDCFIKVLKN